MTLPDTVSVLVPLMVSKAAPDVPVVKLMEAQTAATLTVTVTPLLMTTASADVGTAFPPHVVVLFQFPDAEAVRVAAFNRLQNSNPIGIIRIRILNW